jgi:hypothetical protein
MQKMITTDYQLHSLPEGLECRSKISAYLHSKTHPKKNADAYWIMDGSSKNNDAIDEEDRDA